MTEKFVKLFDDGTGYFIEPVENTDVVTGEGTYETYLQTWITWEEMDFERDDDE